MRIAVGNSRMDKKWKNKDMSWEDFKAKCSQTIRTTETVSEYTSDNRFVSSYTDICVVFIPATQQAMHCTCSVVWCSFRCWSLSIPVVSAINLVAYLLALFFGRGWGVSSFVFGIP